MASSSGLTRRRGAGNAIAFDDNAEGSTPGSPAPRGGPSTDTGPETGYTGGENGHKIAFDPRDINESRERSKQPKLTLMEEVLLMGLKDKQVGGEGKAWDGAMVADPRLGLPVILERQYIVCTAGLHRH